MKVLNIGIALLTLSGLASAQLVPVEWNESGQFTKEVPVKPGRFVEVCEKLAKGAAVAWSFEAGAPLDFNIHFHEGKDVRFPAKRDKVAKDAGTLVVAAAQDYCWMWTNKAAADTSLKLTLRKAN